MSTFDPPVVRKAVEEFAPPRPQKFRDLLPAKDVIVELRQKRASYRSIADSQNQFARMSTTFVVLRRASLFSTVLARPAKA